MTAETGSGGVTFDVQRSPGRSSRWTYSDHPYSWGRSNAELVSDHSLLVRFLQYLYADVEIAATEVCCLSMLSGDQLPAEFLVDMCRQVGDEARHAVAVSRMLSELNAGTDELRYSGMVLGRFRAGSTLAERLAIQHLLQEANAVEVTLDLIVKLRAARRGHMADQFEIINRDESFHAMVGNAWITWLLERDGARIDVAYAQLLRSASAKTGLPVFGKGAWNAEARKSIGFRPSFVSAGEILRRQAVERSERSLD